MGILRRLREWREDKNGTLIGPDIQADSVDAGSVNTGDLSLTELQDFEIELRDDVSASRASETTYQNQNDYAIKVVIQVTVSNGDQLNSYISVSEMSDTSAFGAREDGMKIGSASGETEIWISAIVPPSYYYELENFGDGSISNWFEGGMK